MPELPRFYGIIIRMFSEPSERHHVEPSLTGELYGPLRDPAVFAQAKLDPEAHTVAWPSGADFGLNLLHDWSEHEARLSRSSVAMEYGGRDRLG